MNHKTFLIIHPFLQTITCDCEATPALQLKAFRQHGDKVETSHYRVNVNRLRARLNVVCITEKLLIDLKCDGWPEVRTRQRTLNFKTYPTSFYTLRNFCMELCLSTRDPDDHRVHAIRTMIFHRALLRIFN